MKLSNYSPQLRPVKLIFKMKLRGSKMKHKSKEEEFRLRISEGKHKEGMSNL